MFLFALLAVGLIAVVASSSSSKGASRKEWSGTIIGVNGVAPGTEIDDAMMQRVLSGTTGAFVAELTSRAGGPVVGQVVVKVEPNIATSDTWAKVVDVRSGGDQIGVGDDVLFEYEAS